MAALIQFAAPPSFYHLQLADSAPLSSALSIVANYCNRGDQSSNSSTGHSNSGLVQRLNDKLTAKFQYDPTVRTLRCLSDAEWNSMDCLPAMARIYLKYLTRQSQRIPDQTSNQSTSSLDRPVSSSPIPPTDPMFELQRDFNGGQPFDLSIYKSSLTTLTAMGFPSNEALEALIVTDNKGPESALSHLFADPDLRVRKREEAKIKYVRSQPLGTVQGSTPNPSPSPTDMYREFLRGVLVHDQLSKRSYDAIKSERERRKLSKKEHLAVLEKLEVSEADWERLRKGRAGAAGDNESWDMDCVVCLDSRKSHVVRNCGHLCMCGPCADQLIKAKCKKAKCPMCEQEITEVMKVYL